MKTIADYWKDFSVQWEESSYQRRTEGFSIVEKIATRQREHILARRATAVAYLDKHVHGLHVLEIGCGGGELAIELARRGAAHIVGLDVSAGAVSIACKKAKLAGVAERTQFITGAVEQLWPEDVGPVDLLLGLGILEYLRPEDVVSLVAKIRPGTVFLSFDERRTSIKATLHFVYRQLKQLPYYKKYTEGELRSMFAAIGFPNVVTFRDGNNSFVTSIPA